MLVYFISNGCFNANISDATVIFLYLTAFGNDRLRTKLSTEAKSGTRIVSHYFTFTGWQYVKQEGLPINPLYFAENDLRYRSLGCKPCTVPVPSNAKTINEIVEELRNSKTPERAGRSQDKEKAYMMQKLRSLGYM